MIWILATLLAVLTQVSKNSLSKELGENVSPEAVSLSRFLFGIPVVAIILTLGLLNHGNIVVSM